MDYDIYFDQEYRNTLHEIKDYFQENLISHINDDIYYNRQVHFNTKMFSDVGYAFEGNNILFKNISLLTRPNLHLEKFEVDFKNQCLHAAFKFDQLQVSSDYEINSSRSEDMVHRSGNIKFNFTTNATGQIGIFFNEDSLCPKTYDLHYDIENLQVETSPTESLELFNLDPKNTQPVERKLMSLLQPYIKDYLHNIIFKMVSGNVVDYSVSELLIDEPEHLKRYAEERIEHGNLFIHQCLNDFNNIFEKQSNFKSTQPFLLNLQNDEGGKFGFKEAKLMQTTLKWTYDTSYANAENEEYYFAHVNLDSYQFIFSDVEIQTENESFKGDVTVKPYRNTISFKVIVVSGRKQLCLELIDILDWHFEIKPENEVIENFIRHKLKPYLVGYVWHNTNEILQKCVEQFNAES